MEAIVIVGVEALVLTISLEKVNDKYPIGITYECANGTKTRRFVSANNAHRFSVGFAREDNSPWWNIGFAAVVRITSIVVNFGRDEETKEYVAKVVFKHDTLGPLHEVVLRSATPSFRISFKNENAHGSQE